MPEEPEQLELPLTTFHEGAPGIDPTHAAFMYSAVCVSLGRYHQPPEFFEVAEPQAERSRMARAAWDRPTEQAKSSLNEQKERTEKAAECLALATLRARDGMLVWTRAEHGSGFD